MNIIESEESKPSIVRWQPCVICEHVATCETNCLRYTTYVNQDTVLRRKQDFMRYFEILGLDHV